MKLYTYFRSSAAWRVRIALNIKDIKPEMIPVNLLKGEQRSESYAALNPLHLVPALVDNDEHVLTQSLAIIEYLEETHPHPPLLPRHPHERAYVRALAQAIACDIAPVCNLRVRQFAHKNYGAPEEEWVRHWTQSGLEAVEKMVSQKSSGGHYCFGDTPGLADCVLVPQLYNAKRFNCDFGRFPTLARIGEHCAAHSAFIAAAPENQADAV